MTIPSWPPSPPAASLLRLGFAGTGWIGLNRMEALLKSGLARAAMLQDPCEDMIAKARTLAPDAEIAASFETLLEADLDAVVIASPSGMHACQAIAALESGKAVFCQKPLGRNGGEVRAVVETARKADRLLGLDLSYRHTRGLQAIRKAIREDRLGKVFALDLVFHNAYGPGKSWFFDKAQSGGGCLIDLGVHLVDMGLWLLDFPKIKQVCASLHSGGSLLTPEDRAQTGGAVEDHAAAQLRTENGTMLRLACSWHLHAGTDAVIRADIHGTQAGASFANMAGSFHNFETRLLHATTSELLCGPPEDWGGLAAVQWLKKLANGGKFEREAEDFCAVSDILDCIYSV
ncbi:Gfo/Idh/MocA family protein [Allorhizobium undicola]|uniref:Gfo/Idh/MocA family protein n=1 Tax=Allorhizobium undicola TaxID=78527 RepID=UPI0006870E5F|nr:Gfo/Idh/MocA family oxidoreductase [Allorhizobium undicola]